MSSISLILNLALVPQSTRKEKINTLIKELTPTYPIKYSFNNLDIIGFDVLNESKNRLASAKFTFIPESQFYIVIYGRRKETDVKPPGKNKLEKCKAALIHHNGGYFWSTKTAYFLGEQEVDDFSKAWQIGGIYKVRFAFKAPEFALPGKYKLILFKEKAQFPLHLKLITFDRIKIKIKRSKTHKSEKIEDYNLPLEGCLLNPAIKGRKSISFPWTGNIELFIDKNLRNFKKIIISARGTPAQGEYPLLKVFVNKKELGSVYINSEWNKYEFDLKLNEEAHILKVRFDNDGGGQGEDRNMLVNMIKLVK